MPEETAASAATETPQDTTPQEPKQPAVIPDASELTPEQLKAEVARLTREKADVIRESMGRKAKLQELEAAKQAAEDADKTELQKAQDALKLVTDELEASKRVAHKHTVLSEMRTIGQKLDLSLNEVALTDLYAAGHFKALEVVEGKVQNSEAFLKDLIKERPYLLQNKTASPDIHSQNKGRGGANEFEETRKKAQERQAAKADQKSWMEKAGVVR